MDAPFGILEGFQSEGGALPVRDEAMSLERITPGASLIEILERVLGKGIVLDASARVSQVGIDPMTDDAADCGGLDPDVPEGEPSPPDK